MKLRLRNDFAMSVADAYAMLTDPEFARAVAAASKPLSYDVRADGLSLRVRRTMAADSVVRALTGPTVTILDEITWDPPSGVEHTGSARVRVEKLPGELSARLRLHAGGRGALLDYDGELQVAVPVVGAAIERKAAPILRQAITLQQSVADTWAG